MRRLMLGTFVLSLAMGMVNLAVPLYASELGASYTEIGMLGVTYILLYVLLCVPVGRLGDRMGKRRFVMMGFAGTAAVFLAYHLTFSFPVMLIVRLFQGGMEAFIWTGLQGIVADTSSSSKRGLAMGKYGSSWALGLGIGPLIAGSLYASFGARTIFAIGAMVAAVSTLVIPRLPRPTATSGHHISVRKILYPALIGLPYIGMISVILILFPPYVRTALGMSEAEAGILITIFTLTRALFFIPSGKLSDRVGERALTKWAMLTVSVVYIWFFAAYNLVLLAMLLFGVALGIGMMYPSIMSLASKAGGTSTGYAMGVFNAISGLGWAIFPGAGGFLADVFSPVAPFLMCAIIGIVCSAILAIALRG